MAEKFATKQEPRVTRQDISDQINLQSARMDTRFAQLSQQATKNGLKIEKARNSIITWLLGTLLVVVVILMSQFHYFLAETIIKFVRP